MIEKRFEVFNACWGVVDLKTNVPCGGDAGHGGITLIHIDFNDSGGFNFEVNQRSDKLTIRLYGDEEARMVSEVFRKISIELNELFLKNQKFNQEKCIF